MAEDDVFQVIEHLPVDFDFRAFRFCMHAHRMFLAQKASLVAGLRDPPPSAIQAR
jgi:hypothetical protein